MMTTAVKSKHRKKEGVRSGGRNGRRTKKPSAASVASVAVGLTFTREAVAEKEGGGRRTFCAVLPQRRIAAYLIFTTCTNHDISLPSVVWKASLLTPRLEGGAAVATFTIPSSFSNAGGASKNAASPPLSTYCLTDILHVADTFAYASLIKQAQGS